MKRIERLQRIGALLEARERGARRAMAQANADLQSSIDGLRSVLDQCDRTAKEILDDELGAMSATLPPAAAAAVVQAGLREAGDREHAREEAAGVAQERQTDWLQANRRHEAVVRLVDRWQEDERMEADRRRDNDLDEVIMARQHHAGSTGSTEEARR